METIPRRQLVVDPRFQYGFILKFVLFVTVVLIISFGSLAYVYSKFASIALPISAETGGVVSFGATQGVQLTDFIWPVMLLSVIISAFAMYIFALLLSHRMAGPVSRLRNEISEMADGDLKREVCLREKDYFKLIATDINVLRQQWYETIVDMKTIHEKLVDGVDKEQKKLLDQLDTLLSDLLKTVS